MKFLPTETGPLAAIAILNASSSPSVILTYPIILAPFVVLS